jgi:uncharacterized protein with PQ loop repeat
MTYGIVKSFALVSVAHGYFLESLIAVSEDSPKSFEPLHNTSARRASFLQQTAPPLVPQEQQQDLPVAQSTFADAVPEVETPLLLGFHSQAGTWMYSHALMAWQLLQGFTLVGIVKTLCVTGNMISQVSPFPQVQEWQKRGDTGEADAAPYVSIAFGGWQWCYYGVFAWWVTGRSGFLILLQSNCLGAILGTFYTITYFRTCPSESALMALFKYLSAVSGLVLFEVCTVVALPAQHALFLVGLVSAFCGLLSAISVLVTIPRVVKTRDASSIAGPLVAAGMCNNFFWTICGFILEDRLITLPAIACLCACTTCVYCKLVYPSLDDGVLQGVKKRDQAALSTPAKVDLNQAQHYGAVQANRKIASKEETEGVTPAMPTPTTGGTF